MHYSRSHDAVIRVYDAAGKRDRDARAHGRFQDVWLNVLRERIAPNTRTLRPVFEQRLED